MAQNLETIFCYYCRRHHPATEMTTVITKNGRRWRCIKTLSFQARSQNLRDEFGAGVSALNKQSTLGRAFNRAPHCVKELMSATTPMAGGV